MTASHTVSSPPMPRRSLWIPWVFVGGMAVVVAVNAILITVALNSFSGLVVPKPYERGIRYNEMLAAQDRQTALGWQVKATFVQGSPALTGGILIEVVGQEGAPLDGLIVTGRLTRPVEADPAISLTFVSNGAGRYVARVALSKPGQWELTARLGQVDASFTLVERLYVP